MSDDPSDLAAWVGRTETAQDTAAATPPMALAATLDHDRTDYAAGDALPPLWHWLYFLPRPRARDIGPDGHTRRGGFLPPVALPRRMWAGSRFEFIAPLRVGDRLQRLSAIENITSRTGRSGALIFVTVRHEISQLGEAAPAVREWHDIVYREAPQTAQAAQSAQGASAAAATPGSAGPAATAQDPAAPSAAEPASWQRTLVPDDVLLFRYSALTFNGHRIHYDRRYVTAVEGYPGLVVHGPLIATLLMDLLHRHAPAARVTAFRFKAQQPAFDGQPLHLCGRPGPDGQTVELWAANEAGTVLMQASATLAGPA